jgi:uncharacterized protein
MAMAGVDVVGFLQPRPAARQVRDRVHRDGRFRPESVADVLSTLALVDVESADLTTGPLLPGGLCSADAIHLATALRVDARTMVVYDRELRAAAGRAGIRVVSPGI